MKRFKIVTELVFRFFLAMLVSTIVRPKILIKEYDKAKRHYTLRWKLHTRKFSPVSWAIILIVALFLFFANGICGVKDFVKDLINEEGTTHHLQTTIRPDITKFEEKIYWWVMIYRV